MRGKTTFKIAFVNLKNYFGTIVKNTKSLSPVLIIEWDEFLGQTCTTPGLKISFSSSHIASP